MFILYCIILFNFIADNIYWIYTFTNLLYLIQIIIVKYYFYDITEHYYYYHLQDSYNIDIIADNYTDNYYNDANTNYIDKLLNKFMYIDNNNDLYNNKF